MWGIQPSEFWQMTPQEFWLVHDGRPEIAQKQKGLDRDWYVDLKRKAGA